MIKVVKKMELPDLYSVVIRGINSVSLVLATQTNSLFSKQREEEINIEFQPEDLDKLRLIVQQLEEIHKRQLRDQIDGARILLQQLEFSQPDSDIDSKSTCTLTQNTSRNGSNGHLIPLRDSRSDCSTPF